MKKTLNQFHTQTKPFFLFVALLASLSVSSPQRISQTFSQFSSSVGDLFCVWSHHHQLSGRYSPHNYQSNPGQNINQSHRVF